MASPFQITDGERNVDVDVGGGIVNIPMEHSQIHKGNAYRVDTKQNVADGNTVNIVLTTGDKAVHATMIVASEGSANVAFYEDIDLTANTGNALTPKNAYREKGDNSSVSAVENGTVNTSNATQIVDTFIGSQGSGFFDPTGSGSHETRVEWILKRNTSYALVLENTSGNTELKHIGFDWYERLM
jgi:hypothetical protein